MASNVYARYAATSTPLSTPPPKPTPHRPRPLFVSPFLIVIPSQDGQLVSGGMEELFFWDKTATGAVEPKSSVPCKGRGIIKQIVPYPDVKGMYATCSDRLGASSKPSICVWTIGKNEPNLTIDNFPAKVFNICFGKLPNDKLAIFSTHEDGSILAWDASSGDRLCHSKPHKKKVPSIVYLPADPANNAGPRLLTGSHDHTVKIIDLSSKDMQVLKTFELGRPINTATYCCLNDGKEVLAIAGGIEARDVTTKNSNADEFHVFMYDMISGEKIGIEG